ncbi:hypothetical protein ACIGO7_37935, partial [Streptomyces virginiae]
MHSMTAALAAYTPAPPDPGQEQQARWFADAWNWAAEHLPGGNFTIIGGILLLALLAHDKDKSGKKTDWKKADQAFVGAFKNLWSAITAVFKGLWSIVRFYGGYEMKGEAKSDAGFFKRGTRSTQAGTAGPAVPLGSVAFAPPVVSLTKPKSRRPSPWARHAATWVKTYQGWGASILDRGLRVVLWAVRWGHKTRRGYQNTARVVRAVYGAVAPVVGTLARALKSWHFWPYAARGLARLLLTVVAVGLALPAWRTLTVVVLVLLLVVAVAAAHRFKPAPPGDDAVYGPRLWVILREDLDLPEEEPRENWLLLPNSLGAPGALDIWDPKVQEILASLGPDEFYLGQDTFN